MKSIFKWMHTAAAAVGCAGALMGATSAQAAVFASWTFPANGANYTIGDTLTLTGNANTSGAVSGGLDLALVLDSSGSMATVESGQSRRLWQQGAANALVSALPAVSTSVAVIDFDSSATTALPLTPVSSGIASIQAAINGVNASGGTNIAAGILRATSELTGPNHTAGRTQMMVVVTDGQSSATAAANAATDAIAAGISAVHAVGLPGHTVSTMQGIANAGNGVYTGVSDLSALISLFNGAAGNLVGIDRVDITMNDGSFFGNVAIDGLGNFSSPLATIVAGVNTFTVTAFDVSGASDTATLIINGVVGSQAVPEPGSLALAGLALAGLAIHRRRKA